MNHREQQDLARRKKREQREERIRAAQEAERRKYSLTLQSRIKVDSFDLVEMLKSQAVISEDVARILCIEPSEGDYIFTVTKET